MPAAKKSNNASKNKSESKSTARKSTAKKSTSKKSTAGKNQAGKSSPRKSSSKRSPSKKRAGSRQQDPVNEDIILIVTLVISVLMILSSINLCGPIGRGINYIVFGIIGIMGYIVPFILFFGVAFYLANKGSRAASKKIYSLTILIFSLASFIQIITGYDTEVSMIGYFDACGKNGNGGGIIGSVFLKILYKNFGAPATVIILIAVMLICFMLLSGKTIVSYIKGAGENRILQKISDIRERRAERALDEDYDYYEDEDYEEEETSSRRSAKIVTLKKDADREDNLSPDGLLDEMEERREPESFVDALKAISRKGKKSNKLKNGAAGREQGNKDGGKAVIVDMQEILPEKDSKLSISGAFISAEGSLNPEDGLLSENSTEPLDGFSSGDSIKMKSYIYEEELRRKFGENNGKYFDELDIKEKPDIQKTSDINRRIYTDNDFNETEGHIKDDDFDADKNFSTGQELNSAEEFKSSEKYGRDNNINADGESEFPWPDSSGMTDTDINNLDVFGEYEKQDEHKASNSGLHNEAHTLTDNNLTAGGADKGNGREPASTVIMDMVPIPEPEKPYVFPPIDLLGKPPSSMKRMTEKDLKSTAHKLESTLESFGVKVSVTNVSCGPAVTRYELQPEQGVKVSRITALTDDIKLNLAAADIRIEAPISGKAAVGIEVPNKEVSSVYFRELIEHKDFKNHASDVAFGVGKDISGQVVVTDIGKMPHLLIAGATGSGKSVCINTLIMSILYKSKPSDVKLIMIDPKVVELSVYNGIPHLLYPVVTDPKQASDMLNWAVMEMTDRYSKFADLSVRDLKGYNAKAEELKDTEGSKHYKLPQVVIIVDELADLMMTASKEVETAICRLAQMARAAGMHLIIATQRPSVNVITGVIKANVPSRIAFSVSSAIDSRTIIDGSGAETLLGKGDMLFFPSGIPKPVRVQGAFVSDKEVSAVVDFLKEQNEASGYNVKINEFIANSSSQQDSGTSISPGGNGNGRDDYFAEAGRFIIEKQKASIGMLQRVYKIGFNRAARIMDQLFDAGVVGPEEGTKPRKILMTMEEFEQFISS